MPDSQLVAVKRSDLIDVLRHLTTLVVSLDRIGSAHEYDTGKLTLEFLDDWRVFARLSECRAILSEYFSQELADDDMDELERELQEVEVWSLIARTPRR